MKGIWYKLTGAHKTAAICALLGFVINFSSETTRTSNGVVTQCDYVDFGALLFGAIAIIAGLIALVSSLRDRANDARTALIVIAAVSVLIGLVHIPRGVGAGHDCAPASSSVFDNGF